MTRKPQPPALQALLDAFGKVPDPRVARTRWHSLVNILTIALLGAICGADGWEALELFAIERTDFFATFLEIPNGTPSADTFRRVFEALDPVSFQEAFRHWLKPFLENLEGQTIALDGKSLRGAIAHSRQGGAFHLMHVWAVEQRLLLAQKAVDGAPGEVQAAIELLKLFDLKGATVTADANSCTSSVTAAIRDSGANYVLALKGNRSTLHEHVKSLFAGSAATGGRDVKSFETHDQAHGRIEHRFVWALPIGALPARAKAKWTDLKTAVLVERIRAADSLTLERAYYVTSHRANPKLLSRAIRNHWSIENQLHHCLDVSFAEDRRRIRHENGAQNFALIYALRALAHQAGAHQDERRNETSTSCMGRNVSAGYLSKRIC